MAVIGDSIVWGQGLRQEQKFWHKTQDWLAKRLARPVEYQFLAHSGARIEPFPGLDARPAMHGEIPSPWPSVVRQAEIVRDPERIEFVLLDGGANDVGLVEAVGPRATTEWIAREMRDKCGARMKALLCYAAGLFPNARFAVTGYYPALSAESFAVPDAVVALFTLTGLLELADARDYVAERQTLLDKSYAFADESTRWLEWAVAETNARFPGRVVFARPEIDGPRCFGAADTHLWGVAENDPAKTNRLVECRQVGRVGLFHPGTLELNAPALMCETASVVHPNAKGAVRYYEALVPAVERLLPHWTA